MKRMMNERNGLPGEFEEHHGTIAMFPFRPDIWRDNAIHMQQFIIELITIISKYEKVYLICPERYLKSLSTISLQNITLVPLEYNDIWARDIAPSFTYCKGTLKCIDWKFNAWGGKSEGSYYPWDDDDNFARRFAQYLKLPSERAGIVLEGGAIISDGNGTIFTTRSVLLNRNRNPFKTQHFIEKCILNATGDKQVVWLRQGLATDETNGHIDNMISFVNRHELCLAWTEDKENPNYVRVRNAYEILYNATNCKGEKYKIHRIPLPPMQYMTKKESNGLKTCVDSLSRNAGDTLPASYLNYYLINGAVLIPAFCCETDELVKEQFREIFSDREIIQFNSREPLLGGGGLHCILHEIPPLEVLK